MIIDCEKCAMFESDHCKDCLVMAVLSRKDGSAVTLDPEQEQAVSCLQQAGLAPVLKFKKRAS